MRREQARTRRSAFTLIELMIVVAIIVLLLALLLPAVSAVRDNAKVNTARTQMQMIAMAIDEYAQFWPKFEGLTSRGLPPWRFYELWQEHVDWDYVMHLADPDEIRMGNECLAWCLTAEVGKGPCLKKAPSGLVEYATDDAGAPLLYPAPPIGDAAQVVRLLDPWGTPYLYCWVTSKGYWLVDWNLSVTETALGDEANIATRSFILSAGPDQRFYFLDEHGNFMPDGPDKNPGTPDDPAGPDGLFGTDDDQYGDDIVYGRGR